MKSKRKDQVKQLEKEMKKVVFALELKKPTTTPEGRRDHARLSRKVEKATRRKGLSLASPWEKMKKAFREFLDAELEM